jgi:hypothetical protein
MTVPHDEGLDAEGIPELEDLPPGIDIETEQEGLIPPRDHPIAAGGDSGYATTMAEERTPESVTERAERELPDVGATEMNVGGGVQGSDELGSAATTVDSGDDEVERRSVPQLLDPGSAEGDVSGDGTSSGEAVATVDGVALAPEEAALHVEEDVE